MHPLQGLSIYDLHQQAIAGSSSSSAIAVCRAFFDFYQGDMAKDYLLFMLHQSLASEQEGIGGRERENLLFFYEYLIRLLDAAAILGEKGKDGPRKPRRRS